MHRWSRSLSRRSLIRTTIAGGTLLAASGILAACGGGTSAPAPTAAAGAPAAAPTTAAGAAPAPTAAPAGGAATAAPAAAAPTTAAAAAAPAKAAPGATQIRVSVWPDVADLQINQQTIDAFTKKNGGKIAVTPEQWVGNYYQKLQVGIAGNTVPDMVYFQGWTWQPYALGGQVFDLSEYISRDKSQLPADLYPDNDAYTRQIALKGKHYGVPVDTGSMVMYYNKDLFDAAGVPYPKDEWTYDDWLSTVQKVQDGLKKANKDGVFAYQPNYNDPYVRDFPWWRMTGAQEFDQLENPKSAKFTDPAIAAAWQLELHDLAQKGLAISQAALVSGGGTNAYYTFGIQNGLAAMKVEGPWFLPQMWGDKAATKGGLKFDVVHMPKGSKGTSMFWQVEPITIWKTSKNADSCWEYLKFAASEDGQQFVAQGGRMTNTPSSITKIWAPLVQKTYNFQNAAAFAFADGASMVDTGGTDTNQLGLQGGLNAARDAVINGSKKAQDALAEANPKVQAVLDTWWKANPNG